MEWIVEESVIKGLWCVRYGDFCLSDIPSPEIANKFVTRAVEEHVSMYFNEGFCLSILGDYVVNRIIEELN